MIKMPSEADAKGRPPTRRFLTNFAGLIVLVGIILCASLWCLVFPFPKNANLPPLLKCPNGYEAASVAGGAACVHLTGPISVNPVLN